MIKNIKILSYRPTTLPDAESLYDELQIVRKEIATQQKVIKTQQTRNGRLEAELKKRESQLADIFDGTERKRYFLLGFRFFSNLSIINFPLR